MLTFRFSGTIAIRCVIIQANMKRDTFAFRSYRQTTKLAITLFLVEH